MATTKQTKQTKNVVALYQCEVDPPHILGIHENNEQAIQTILKDILKDAHDHPYLYMDVYRKCEKQMETLTEVLESSLKKDLSFFQGDGAHNWYISECT
jgi:hypothetical protein